MCHALTLKIQLKWFYSFLFWVPSGHLLRFTAKYILYSDILISLFFTLFFNRVVINIRIWIFKLFKFLEHLFFEWTYSVCQTFCRVIYFVRSFIYSSLKFWRVRRSVSSFSLVVFDHVIWFSPISNQRRLICLIQVLFHLISYRHLNVIIDNN